METFKLELTKTEILDLITAINYGIQQSFSDGYYFTGESFMATKHKIFASLGIKRLCDLYND